MGFSTVWRMGSEEEARLWWEGKLPPRHPELYLKFVTELELQCLRAAICQTPETVAEIVRTVKVQEQAFPRVSDPEWQEWYENMVESSPNPVDWVLPEFVEELRSVADEVETVAARWHSLWDADRLRTLDHAVWCLRELTGFAVAARRKKMGALSRVSAL